MGCSYSLPGCVLAFGAQLRSFFANFGGHRLGCFSCAAFGQVFNLEVSVFVPVSLLYIFVGALAWAAGGTGGGQGRGWVGYEGDGLA